MDAVLHSLLIRSRQIETVKTCKIRGSCTNIVAAVGGRWGEAAAAVDAVLSSLLQGPMIDPEADRDDLHEST